MSRVLVSYSTNAILQVEGTPDVGIPTAINGKYPIPIPSGSKVDIDSSSYVLPVDGGDISSLSFSGLLAQYPMYDNIVFNPLLEASDVADLDLSATLPQPSPASPLITRAQVGRGSGPMPTGIAPASVAILGSNATVSPARPGLLVTDTIDITAATSGSGASDFMVWWKIYDFSTSDDVMSDFGSTAGRNDPAIRSIFETDQEPSDLEVSLSIDDGATYTVVGRLEPISFCVKDNFLRLALKNTGSSKIYLAAYAIMF